MKKFEVVSPFEPSGDQVQAIDKLAEGFLRGDKFQTLKGVTGSGKTFTMAKIIEKVQRPTLIISHNKTLSAQLYREFKTFFPNNAVEYFVSGRYIGFRLIIIVIRDKIFNCVMWKESFKLAVKLSTKSFVMTDN